MKSLLYYCYAMCLTTITYVWNFIMQITNVDATVEIIKVVAPIVGIAISGYVSYKLAKLHKEINSRMTELLEQKGIASEAIGKAEGKKEEKAEAKADIKDKK